MKKLIAILLVLSNTPVFAADPDNVTLVEGATAPYAGILIPVARAQRIQLMSIDLDTCTKRLNLAAEDGEAATRRINNFSVEVKTLREENDKKTTFLSQFGMFLLGVGSATLMAYGISRATK